MVGLGTFQADTDFEIIFIDMEITPVNHHYFKLGMQVIILKYTNLFEVLTYQGPTKILQCDPPFPMTSTGSL